MVVMWLARTTPSLVSMCSAFVLRMTSRMSAFSAAPGRLSIHRQSLLNSSALENSHHLESPLSLPSAPNQRIETVCAPMVGASDYPFRCLVRQHGVDLAFTQMLHARHILQSPTFLAHHRDFVEYEDSQPTRNDLVPVQREILGDLNLSSQPPCSRAIHGPLIVQLSGHCVTTVTEAAERIVEETPVAGIDLNLGCPQMIAKKGRYGAFLMEEQPETVFRMLESLRDTLPPHVSVSAKIRLPLDPSVQTDRIQRLRATGINFLTVHGRDLTENKVKVGSPHFDRLRDAVQAAGPLPVIANGGVETYSDFKTVLQATGAAAVMSSEAFLERPNLLQTRTERNTFRDQIGLARSYLDWCCYFPPLPGVLGEPMNIVKGHLFKLLYPYLQTHTDQRDRLAGHLKNLPDAYDLLQTLDERGWCEETETMSWYRRHRRNEQDIQNNAQLAPEERKHQIRARIAQLKEQKKRKLSSFI